MSEECDCPECEEGVPAWVMTFADLMTLLMCFFVLLLSFSIMDAQKFQKAAGSLREAFGVQRIVPDGEIPQGESIIAQEFSPGKPEPTPIQIVQQKTVDVVIKDPDRLDTDSEDVVKTVQMLINKLEDEDTGEVHYTDVACRLLDLNACRCVSYDDRKRYVPDCQILNPKNVKRLSWLPATCAYRLIDEGKDLHWWHPLVSGTPATVHEAGISVQGWTVPEFEVHEDEWEEFIIEDPT